MISNNFSRILKVLPGLFGFFLLSASLFAQTNVTTNAGDQSAGSLGWAVTTLNNAGAGAISIDSSVGPITLTQPLVSVSQDVTFQGTGAGIIGQNDAQSQFLFQQGFTLDTGAALTFTNNGALSSGLDTAFTVDSVWTLSANSSFSLTGGAGPSQVSGGMAGVTVGATWAMSGSSFLVLGGAGGAGPVAGDGGAAAVSALSLSLSDATGTIGGGTGGAGSFTNGNGGAASLSVDTLGLVNAGQLDLQGGNGGVSTGGTGALGNGGTAVLTSNSITLTGTGTQLNIIGGAGGYPPVVSTEAGPANAGNGGAALLTSSSLSVDSQALVSLTGGDGGQVQNTSSGVGGTGGGVTVFLGSLSLTNGGSLGMTAGNGGQGTNGGNGGGDFVTVGAVIQGTGSSLSLVSGDGGGGASGGTINYIETSQAMASGATFLVAGGSGGSGNATGGNGGSVNVDAQALTVSSGALWEAFGGAAGTGTSTNGASGNLNVLVGDLQGSGTVSLGGGGADVLQVGEGNFGGVLSGTENLEKTGSNALTLSGVNTYSGGTSVEGGTLAVFTGGTLGTAGVYVDVGDTLAYINSSVAGSNPTTVANSGNLVFQDNASAGTAQVNLLGQALFQNNSTGGSAQFTVASSGSMVFQDNASALNAQIDNSGQMNFLNSATAGNASITLESGGSALFYNTTDGGTAQFTLIGGLLDASGTAALTIGSLSSSVTTSLVNLGASNLGVGSNNLSTDYSGAITGLGSLTKLGSGALTLAGNNSYQGGTTLLAGSFVVDTNGTLGMGGVQVNSGILDYIHSSVAANVVTVSSGGVVEFQDNSSAGLATFYLSGGAEAFFAGQAMGGIASFADSSGATLDLTASTQNVTIGSLSGGGQVSLGSYGLAVGTNGAATTFSGNLSGAGSLALLGSSVFTLSNANTYSGGTTVNGGMLLAGNSQALGTGSVAVNGGTLAVSGGPLTLMVGGSYNQFQAGTLQLGLGGSGSDSLSVGGAATLGGTLSLVSYGGLTLPVGQALTLVSAGSLQGSFQNVTEALGGGVRLLPLYQVTQMEMESINPSFALSGSTANQVSIGADLDNVYGQASLYPLILQVGVMSNSNLRTAEDQLSPADFSALYQAGFEQARAREGLVANRLSQLAVEVDNTVWLPGFSDAGSPFFAADMPASQEASMPIKKTTPWSGFISGNSGFFNVSPDGNAAGYQVTNFGLTGAGADYRLSREMVAGLMVGYSHTDVTLSPGGSLTGDGGEVGLYGLYYSDGLFADALVEGGLYSYGTQRAAYGGTATGSTQGQQFDGAVQLGYQWNMGKAKLGPVVSAQYSNVQMNGFTEQGSLAPLTIPNQSQDFLLSQLSLEFSGQWSLSSSTLLNPSLQLGWEHEYDNKGGAISAGFGTGPGDSFTVLGPQVGQDGIVAGVGVNLTFSKTLAVALNYQGELARTNLSSNQVGLGAKLGF